MHLANLSAMLASSTLRLTIEMIIFTVLNIYICAADDIDLVNMFVSQVHGTERPQSWRRDVTQRRRRGRKVVKQAEH